MARPSVEFLCDCLATALLSQAGVTRVPVPVRAMLLKPPPDLSGDLGLIEVTFGEAMWLRLPSGRATVFVNAGLPEPEQRYAMARAMFIGLCTSTGGQAAGLPGLPNVQLQAHSDLFARRLLMAPQLLPDGWKQLGAQALADLCGVPEPVAETQLLSTGNFEP